MPTPPSTISAPVFVLVLDELLVIEIAEGVELPLLVTDRNVLVFHITVISPEAVLTAVSVPA